MNINIYMSSTRKYGTKKKTQKMGTKPITDFFHTKTTPPQKYDRVINVFTDGSTVDNGKPNAKGGFGVFFSENDVRNVGEPFFLYPITNNRCELYGCIKAIETIGKTEPLRGKTLVNLYTDSEYIVNSINKWLPGWKARGWRKAKGKPLENKDFLYCLDKLMHLYRGFFEIRFLHINAAHDYDQPKDKMSKEWILWNGNDSADKLARQGTTISIKLDKLMS